MYVETPFNISELSDIVYLDQFKHVYTDDFIADKYPGTEKSYSAFASEVTVIDEENFDLETLYSMKNKQLALLTKKNENLDSKPDFRTLDDFWEVHRPPIFVPHDSFGGRAGGRCSSPALFPPFRCWSGPSNANRWPR